MEGKSMEMKTEPDNVGRSGVVPLVSTLGSEAKFLVTRKGLDDWIAQLYGYTVNDIPSVQPENMPRTAYLQLRKYVKKENTFMH
jgi:hypothetical protein